MIDRFGLVLRRYTCEIFPFRFRNTEFLKGILDLFRDIVPAAFRFFTDALVIRKILEIDFGKIRSPFGHRHFLKLMIGFHTEFRHPFRFLFDLADGTDNVFIDTLSGVKNTDVLIGEAVLIFILGGKNFPVIGFTHCSPSLSEIICFIAFHPMVAHLIRFA